MRWRPPAAKVRVSCHTPSSSREESHSTSSRSTPRSRRRSETRSARVTGPAPRLPTAHFWATCATYSRSASTGPSKRRTFSTVQPARSATSSADSPRRIRACTSRGRRPPSISICSWPRRGRSRRAAARSASSRAEAVAAAVGVREQEVLAVLVDADEAKVLHVGLPELLVVETTVPSRAGAVTHPTPRPRELPAYAVRMSDAADALAPYDAVLLVSFGGPEAPGRRRAVPAERHRRPGHPRERLEEVGEHYFARRRPQPDQRPEPRRCWPRCAPSSTGAASTSRSTGATATGTRSSPTPCTRRRRRRHPGASPCVTSAYSSYSSCRQYREDLAAAVDAVGPAADGLVVDKVRPYCPPRLRRAWLARSSPTVARAARRRHARARPVRHPLGPDGDGRHVRARRRRGQPLRRPARARWRRRLTDEVNRELGPSSQGELVFCSRSGPPHPAVARARRQRPPRGARRRGRRHRGRACPIGFVSDHMEVVYDLDTEAAETAERLGLPFVRVPTPGTDARFVEGWSTCCSSGPPRRGEVVVPETWLPGDVRPVGLRARAAAPTCAPPSRRSAAATDADGIRPAGRRRRSPTSRRSPAGWPAPPAGSSSTSGPPTCGSPSKSSATDVVTVMDQRSQELILRAARRGAARRRGPGRGGGQRHRHQRGHLGRRPDRRHRQLPLRHPVVRRVASRSSPATRPARATGSRWPGRCSTPRPASCSTPTVGGGARLTTDARHPRACAPPRPPTWRRPWSAPGSATTPRCGPGRRPCSSTCCRRCATSGGTAVRALDLCGLAAGRLDAYYESGAQPVGPRGRRAGRPRGRGGASAARSTTCRRATSSGAPHPGWPRCSATSCASCRRGTSGRRADPDAA